MRSWFLSLAVLFTFCLTISTLAKDKIIAVASQVSGNVFYMSGGKTQVIKVGTHIPSQAEIFTEVGARLSINDYYDHLYHLSGSGHITLHRNLLELKSGYLWTQTKSYDDKFGPLRIVTSNAEISYEEGEGIISFDNALGKTQLLSVKGNFVLKNSLEKYMVTDVAEGKFSFIDASYQEGAPRIPTSVGYGSFKKMTKLFAGVAPLSSQSHSFSRDGKDDNVQVTRTVASTGAVQTNFEKALLLNKGLYKEKSPSTSQGTIHFVSNREHRLEKESKQVRLKLLQQYQDKIAHMKKKVVKKKWRPSYGKRSQVTVRVFGAPKYKKASKIIRITTKSPSRSKSHKKTSRRMPASIKPSTMTAQTMQKSSRFEDKLTREYGKQMRHKSELNSLIDELQSVDADYKKNY
jgi:hypothetical protein